MFYIILGICLCTVVVLYDHKYMWHVYHNLLWVQRCILYCTKYGKQGATMKIPHTIETSLTGSHHHQSHNDVVKYVWVWCVCRGVSVRSLHMNSIFIIRVPGTQKFNKAKLRTFSATLYNTLSLCTFHPYAWRRTNTTPCMNIFWQLLRSRQVL